MEMAGTLMGLPASSQPLAFCYAHALSLTILAIALPLKLSLPLPLPPHTHCCNTIAILLTILALLQRRDRKSSQLPSGQSTTVAPQTSVRLRTRSIRIRIPRTSTVEHSLPNRNKNTYTHLRERIPRRQLSFSRPRRAESDL